MNVEHWRMAVAQFRKRVEAAYGDRLEGVYLYGSRARGEAGAESDADIAVLLRDPDFWPDLYRLSDLAFDAMLDAGLVIHARPVPADDWRSDAPAGSFLAEMRKDAVVVERVTTWEVKR